MIFNTNKNKYYNIPVTNIKGQIVALTYWSTIGQYQHLSVRYCFNNGEGCIKRGTFDHQRVIYKTKNNELLIKHRNIGVIAKEGFIPRFVFHIQKGNKYMNSCWIIVKIS